MVLSLKSARVFIVLIELSDIRNVYNPTFEQTEFFKYVTICAMTNQKSVKKSVAEVGGVG